MSGNRATGAPLRVSRQRGLCQSQAVFYFQKACSGGDAVGCRNLAILYDAGTQIAQNLGTAKQYYQNGCTGNDQPSCDALKNAKFQ
jgi:TPR repeat protein